MAISDHDISETHVIHMDGAVLWTNRGVVHDQENFIVQDVDPNVGLAATAAAGPPGAAPPPPQPKAKPKAKASQKQRSRARRGT